MAAPRTQEDDHWSSLYFTYDSVRTIKYCCRRLEFWSSPQLPRSWLGWEFHIIPRLFARSSMNNALAITSVRGSQRVRVNRIDYGCVERIDLANRQIKKNTSYIHSLELTDKDDTVCRVIFCTCVLLNIYGHTLNWVFVVVFECICATTTEFECVVIWVNLNLFRTQLTENG